MEAVVEKAEVSMRGRAKRIAASLGLLLTLGLGVAVPTGAQASAPVAPQLLGLELSGTTLTATVPDAVVAAALHHGWMEATGGRGVFRQETHEGIGRQTLLLMDLGVTAFVAPDTIRVHATFEAGQELGESQIHLWLVKGAMTIDFQVRVVNGVMSLHARPGRARAMEVGGIAGVLFGFLIDLLLPLPVLRPSQIITAIGWSGILNLVLDKIPAAKLADLYVPTGGGVLTLTDVRITTRALQFQFSVDPQRLLELVEALAASGVGPGAVLIGDTLHVYSGGAISVGQVVVFAPVPGPTAPGEIVTTIDGKVVHRAPASQIAKLRVRPPPGKHSLQLALDGTSIATQVTVGDATTLAIRAGALTGLACTLERDAELDVDVPRLRDCSFQGPGEVRYRALACRKHTLVRARLAGTRFRFVFDPNGQSGGARVDVCSLSTPLSTVEVDRGVTVRHSCCDFR